MTHLLDAHTLIWSQDDSSKLSAAAAIELKDPTNVLAVGVETIWEIGIKVSIGKLKLTSDWWSCLFNWIISTG